MKLEAMKQFTSWKQWAIGVHVFSTRYGTLVVLLGTAWTWGYKGGKGQFSDDYCFGLTLGPLTIGGAIHS